MTKTEFDVLKNTQDFVNAWIEEVPDNDDMDYSNSELKKLGLMLQKSIEVDKQNYLMIEQGMLNMLKNLKKKLSSSRELNILNCSLGL